MTVKLHIETHGPKDGRNVVLIHGWPLSSRSWEKQVPQLVEAGFRVTVYDRRGFGRSDKPEDGYDYDTLAADLERVLAEGDLRGVTLVGFSMGGGEVARYVSRFGEGRLAGVVFASAVPPYLLQTPDNPEGPLTEAAAAEMEQGLRRDRTAFFDDFMTQFFSSGDVMKASEVDRQKAIAMCHESDQTAALACMKAFATTDFREDLKRITVPVLVLHGGGDGTVPLAGSGQRTHAAIPGSTLTVLPDAPHGCNTGYDANEFTTALLAFLENRPLGA